MPSFVKVIGVCIVIVLGSAVAGAGEKVRIDLVPAADGDLIGSSKDNIYDKVSSSINDSKSPIELKVGEVWGNNRKVILEFILPESIKGREIKSATLHLWPNGKFGHFPDTEGAGPESRMYYYTGSNVDEKVSKEDNDGGMLIGTVLAKDLKLTSKKGVVLDVLVAVDEAVKNNAEGVGFRIERLPESEKNIAWRFRSSEFGQKYGANFSPYLLIELK